MERRPNLLVVMADQLAPHFTGTYGHPLVQTPHLDALAARGTVFTAAYCNSPLCAPSRFSFLAGRLPDRIGAFDNASELSASTPTWVHALRSLGYHTSLAGKMHFVGPDQLHGFEQRLTTDVYPADFGWVPDWDRPGERIDRWYHNMDSVRDAGPVVASVQLDFDEEVAFAAVRRLRDHARSDAGPFCLVVGFTHPHDPYEARWDQWERYDHAAIDLPSGADALDPHSRRVRAGIALSEPPGDDAVRRARHAYYANVSYVDDRLGELVGALEQLGLLDDTVVVFTADHGEALGERGLWYKMTMREHSVRVPLVMAGPGIATGQVDEVCSLLDLAPTFVELASTGATPPPFGAPLDGRSLLSLAAGGVSGGRAGEAAAVYCAECTSAPVVMLRRGEHKLIHCPTDPPLLFDLRTDPGEHHDLATDSAFAPLLADLTGEVRSRWDLRLLRDRVVASQHRRRAVHAALERGVRTHWDFQPHADAADRYVRSHIDWADAAGASRLPRPD